MSTNYLSSKGIVVLVLAHDVPRKVRLLLRVGKRIREHFSPLLTPELNGHHKLVVKGDPGDLLRGLTSVNC